jgi:multimeric flavodoxin WrbA
MTSENEVKKVLVLLGSPRRKGNSAILAERIAKGAKSAGADVETFFIHGMKIAPCNSCYACQKPNSKGCSINDDMQIVYKKLMAADAWIIASPVYWFTVSAQTKLWMDRSFALLPRAKEAFTGKRIAIAMSYGDSDPFKSGCVNALRTFQDAYGYVEACIVGMVYGSAMDAGEIKKNKSLMKEALELGKQLVQSKINAYATT